MTRASTAEGQVIDIVQSLAMCDLEEVIRRCPTLAWGQVFLAIDRLSRTGQIRLIAMKAGRYSVTVACKDGSRPDQHSLSAYSQGG